MSAWVGIRAAAVLIVATSVSAICTPAIAADQTDPPAPATTSVAPGQADWRTRFDAVYRLEEGQTLRFVPAPFIPERLEYHCDRYSERFAKGPDSIFFHWEAGTLKPWGELWGSNGHDVVQISRSALGIESYQLEGPATLLRLRLPDGDFIVRDGTTEAQRLAALQDILRQHTGRSVRFELQNLEREVIVARGRYAFHPLPDSESESAIQFYVGAPDPDEGGGGGSGALEQFLQILGRQTGRRVIDETDKPHPQQRIAWLTSRSSYLVRLPEGPARAARTDQLLAVIAQQTDLSLIRERRKLPVWVLSERN